MTSNSNDGFLPLDLINEILLRMPVKSLGRLKLVCKSWNSWISTHSFAKSHFKFSASHIKPASLPSRFPVNLGECRHSPDGSISPSKLAHSFIFSEYSEWLTIGSCHGLMCSVHCNAETFEESITVSNPTTKECRTNPFPENRVGYFFPGTGFGFAPSLDDYKIVMLMHGSPYQEAVNRVDVFSFRDDQWRTLDISSTNLHSSLAGSNIVCKERQAVWLNEALYWGASIHPGEVFILEFDLAKERFSRASDVTKIGDDIPRIECYGEASLGVIAHNCLCVGQPYAMESDEIVLEIWMMGEYGQMNRLFRFQLDPLFVPECPPLRSFGFTPDGNVLLLVIDRGRLRIFLLDPRQNPPTYVSDAEAILSFVMTCSASLVSPFHVRKVEH